MPSHQNSPSPSQKKKRKKKHKKKRDEDSTTSCNSESTEVGKLLWWFTLSFSVYLDPAERRRGWGGHGHQRGVRHARGTGDERIHRRNEARKYHASLRQTTAMRWQEVRLLGKGLSLSGTGMVKYVLYSKCVWTRKSDLAWHCFHSSDAQWCSWVLCCCIWVVLRDCTAIRRWLLTGTCGQFLSCLFSLTMQLFSCSVPDLFVFLQMPQCWQRDEEDIWLTGGQGRTEVRNSADLIVNLLSTLACVPCSQRRGHRRKIQKATM